MVNRVNVELIAAHWDELLRLGAAIHHGAVPPSLLLTKVQAFLGPNTLARALQEHSRLVKTVLILRYLQRPEMWRRVGGQLNKGVNLNGLRETVNFARGDAIRHRQPAPIMSTGRGPQASSPARTAAVAGRQDQGPPRGAGQGAVPPGESALVRRPPHLQVVGVADQRQAGADDAGVHRGGHHGRDRQPPALVRGQHDRCRRDQQQVDRQEPQLQGHQPAGLRQLRGAHAGHPGPGDGEHDNCYVHGRWSQQPIARARTHWAQPSPWAW
jgi:Tn3 transposase DDE domain